MIKRLLKLDLYNSIPEDDFNERQRYLIFVILSGFIFAAIMLSFVETLLLNYPSELLILKVSLPVFATVILGNYIFFQKHRNAKIAYTLFIGISFLMLHVYAYYFGGIFSSTNYYLGVFALSTFMLLGRKAGWGYIILACTHVILMCYLNINTHVIHNFQGTEPGAWEEDMAFAIIMILVLIGVHSSSLEKTRAIIMRTVKNSHIQMTSYAGSLEKTNKELDRFAYVVSHDLKAPLRAISNLSQWIEEDIEEDLTDETRKNFDLLRNRVARMEALISGILDYSRANRQDEKDEAIDTRSLLDDIVFMLAPPKHISISIDNDMPTLYMGKIKLQQIFSNLISNAIKYNDKPEGQIEIACREMKNNWEFLISDNGIGIAPEYHEKVFEIFQTLHSKDKYESTGVGLAIVKKIVEELGGSIKICSEKDNGACFSFTIPKGIERMKASAMLSAA